MPRPTGLAKTGGRKQGTPNRRTEILSDVLTTFDCNVPAKLVELLPQLSPDKQASVLLGLLPYLYPKRSTVELDHNDYQLMQANRKQVAVAMPDIDPAMIEVCREISKMSPEQRLAHAKNLNDKMAFIDSFENEPI